MKGAREEILSRLKNSIHPEPERPDFDTPVYHPIQKPLEAFKENLEKVNGSVYLMSSEEELFEVVNKLLEELSPNEVVCYEQNLIHQLQNHAIPFSTPDVIPENLKVGITSCEFLIAHTGTAMVSSAQAGGRQLFVFPPVHVIIARKAQLVDYLNAAYRGIQKKYGNQLPSQISLITGPSRTADIEKTLVMGAHGPRELHVLIY